MADRRKFYKTNRRFDKMRPKMNLADKSLSHDKSLRLESLESRLLLSVDLTAHAGGPYIIDEGQDLHLDGSASEFDPDFALYYYWDINGNGQYDDPIDLTGESPSLPWSTLEGLGAQGDGTTVYNIGLKVEREGWLFNFSDTDTTTVTINNVAPTADAGGPYAVDKGEGITLDASDSSDPNANDLPLTYAWDLDNDGLYGTDDSPNEPTTSTAGLSWSVLQNLGLHNVGDAINIGVKVMDDVSEDTDQTFIVVVNNEPPVAEAGGPDGTFNGKGIYEIDEGQPLPLNASGTNDPDGDKLMYLWDLDGDGVFDDAAKKKPDVPWETLEALALPSDGSLHKIRLMVLDGDPGGYDFNTAWLKINNLDPTADANGPFTVNEGQGVWLDASDSTDPDNNDNLSYKWTFRLDPGDPWQVISPFGSDPAVLIPWNQLESLGVPGDGSPVDLALIVRDEEGGKGTDTAELIVNNVAPVADADGPYMVAEGLPGGDLVLKGGKSYDVNDNDSLEYKWFIGDENGWTSVGINKNQAVSWTTLQGLGLADDGTPLGVALKVQDGDGGVSVDKSLLLVIQNLAPDITAVSATGENSGGVGEMDEGDNLQLHVAATDPGGDALMYLWDLDNDGVYDDASGSDPVVPWAYLEQLVLPDGSPLPSDSLASIPISVMVFDGEEQGFSYDSTTLIINNVDPIADVDGRQGFYVIDEGQPLWLDASNSYDPNGNDNLKYIWKVFWNGSYHHLSMSDGSIVQIPWQRLENIGIWGDGSPLDLKLSVWDNDGGHDVDHGTLIVNNVDPVADAGGPYMILEGNGVMLNGSGSYDVNANDYPLGYKWFVADENGVQLAALDNDPFTFVSWNKLNDILNLASDGTSIAVGLKVTDLDGGTDLDKDLLLVIQNATPIADAGGPYKIDEGQPLELDASGSSDPGQDPLTFLWDLDGDGVYDDAAGEKPIVPWETLEALGLPSDGTPMAISVRVDDGEEHGVSYARSRLVIDNLEPIPDAGGPYVINEGRPLWVDARGTTDPDANDDLVYAWDIYADGVIDYFAGADPLALIPWQVLENAGVPGDGDPIRLRLIVGDQEGNGQAKRAHQDVALTVNNVDPTADANGPYVIDEGSGVQLIGSNSSDPNANDILPYDWDLNDDGTFDILAQMNPFVTWATLHDTFGLASDGTTLVLNLRVSDNHGGVDNDRALLLVVNNLAPSVDAGGDYIISEGEDLPLNGSGSDPGGDPLTFLWDLDNDGAFDDASTTDPLVPWDHLKLVNLKTDGQPNTIALMADDGEEGGVNVDTANLIINNVAPTANAGPDHEINEGDTAHFFGSFQEPYGDLDGPFLFEWNFGDGSPIANTEHAAHTYIDNGVFTVNFDVTDKDNGTGNDQAVVTVLNVAPDVDAGEDKVSTEGEMVPFSGQFTDPGLNDTHKITWDFGDGEVIVGTFGDLSLLDVQHTYADDGEYTVTLTIEDDDGGIGTDTLTVFVFNEGPWVYAGPDHGIDEGDTVSFSMAAFSDVLADIPPDSITWDFGDGSPLVVGDLNPTHTYVDDGLYVARLTIDDGDGGVEYDEATIVVDNVAPIINVGPDALANMDEPFFFSGSATDPGGVNDPLTITWDFGDGIAADGSLFPVHTYTESGYYTVRLTVADDDGGVSSDTLQMTVQQLLPIVNNSTFVHTLAGLVKVKLRGPGELVQVSHIAGSGIDLNTVELNDTTEQSSLIIQTKGPKSFANLGDVNVHSSLKQLKGNTTNLKGVVQIDTGSLGKAKLASIQEQGSINVLSDIGQVKVKQNLEGTVNAGSSIGKVIGNKGVLSGTIRAADTIEKVKFSALHSATVSAGDDIDKVFSKTDIVDSQLLAGYDIGADALPGTGDELLNAAGATIGKIKVHPAKGNFDNSYAMAGVQPFDFGVNTRTMLAANPADQILASFGAIEKATVGQIFLNGDPGTGIYGLFTATEPITNVTFTEVGAAGAPDFEARWSWI